MDKLAWSCGTCCTTDLWWNVHTCAYTYKALCIFTCIHHRCCRFDFFVLFCFYLYFLKRKFIKYLLNCTPLFPLPTPPQMYTPCPKWWTSCFQSHGREVFRWNFPRAASDISWLWARSGPGLSRVRFRSQPVVARGTATISLSSHIGPFLAMSGAPQRSFQRQ